jgi:hypothetical protein
MNFSFADVYAREARQQLEQEKPAAKPQTPPAEANENLLRVSPEEVDSPRQTSKSRKA